MGSWTFLSNHGRVLLLLARDPGMPHRRRTFAGFGCTLARMAL